MSSPDMPYFEMVRGRLGVAHLALLRRVVAASPGLRMSPLVGNTPWVVIVVLVDAGVVQEAMPPATAAGRMPDMVLVLTSLGEAFVRYLDLVLGAGWGM